MTLQELIDALMSLLDNGVDPSTQVELWMNDDYLGNKVIETAESVSVYKECEYMGGGNFVRIASADD